MSCDGSLSPGDSVDTFGDWTHVAGTGDTVLFYNSASGIAASVILKDGQYYDDYDSALRLATGWQVIAGGR